ncbi:hypothetical protein H6G91_21340 [Nostoc muscorum FACHB-395]|nr:hypothetical protein [Desmonostoc muscorum FACHB-395]
MEENKLVFDRTGSRRILMQALEESERRLILVCPWVTNQGVNESVISSFTRLLESGVEINLGWGYKPDIFEKNKTYFSQKDFDNIINSWKYSGLKKLIPLKERYPNLGLKLLCTHEKYLVCDYNFAMLGSHNFLTSIENNDEREVGFYTTDIGIVQDLIERFDNAKNFYSGDTINEDDFFFDEFSLEQEAMGYYAFGENLGISYEQYLDMFC